MRLAVQQRQGAPDLVLADRGVAGAPDIVATGFTSLVDALEAGVVDGGRLDETALAAAGPLASVPEPDPSTLRPPAGPAAKVFCVGHNYRAHILELGHQLPEFPTVFSKYAESLVGPHDDVALDPVADLWDWEAELALTIGRAARRVAVDDAHRFIAGYTVANDVTARDWQRRTSQWLLGKTFPATTPLGPWLTLDDRATAPDLTIACAVDGEEKQRASTGDLLFGPAFLVAYLSTVVTLQPGDVVLTGTPGGVGVARNPVERLRPGQLLTTTVEGLGTLENRCVAPSLSDSGPSDSARPAPPPDHAPGHPPPPIL